MVRNSNSGKRRVVTITGTTSNEIDINTDKKNELFEGDLTITKQKEHGKKANDKLAAKAGKTGTKSVKRVQKSKKSDSSKDCIKSKQKSTKVEVAKTSKKEKESIGPIESAPSKRLLWIKDKDKDKFASKTKGSSAKEKHLKDRPPRTITRKQLEQIVYSLYKPSKVFPQTHKEANFKLQDKDRVKHCYNNTHHKKNCNYYSPLIDDTTMPLLTAEDDIALPIGIGTKFKDTNVDAFDKDKTQEEPQEKPPEENEGEWIPVGTNKQKPPKKLDPVAPAYSPKTMPNDTGFRRETDVRTKKMIPTLIIIKPKRKVIYDLGRILHALLLAFQEKIQK